MVECKLINGTIHQFQGACFIPLISNDWNQEIIRRNVRGMVVELNNHKGVLRHEGKIKTPIDYLIVNNEEGVTRLMNDIEAGADLSWSIDLHPSVQQAEKPPAQTPHACLKHPTDMITRIFAMPSVTLGRPMEGADLWLHIFPLGNTKNQTRMLRISRQHISITQATDSNGFSLNDLSTNGTSLNGQLLTDDKPHPLQSGDTIGFAHNPGVLTLQISQPTEHSLQLHRTDNGANLENYLLIPPDHDSATPIGGGAAIIHHNGSFYLHALDRG